MPAASLRGSESLRRRQAVSSERKSLKIRLTRQVDPRNTNVRSQIPTMPIFRRTTSDAGKRVRNWARPEMKVTFRAEVMPGRSREERTFTVKEVMSNGRVSLYNFPDEHREGAFEPINFLRKRSE